MGVFEYPCPSCGTPQKERAPNGTEVTPRLCAACQEKEREEARNVQKAKDDKEAGREKARAR